MTEPAIRYEVPVLAARTVTPSPIRTMPRAVQMASSRERGRQVCRCGRLLTMPSISYARHQFPPPIIRHAVWLYLRFTLSFRDVEELLAERGIEVSYESVRRWVVKFGPAFARELRRRRPRPSSQWHLDEMAVQIGGKRLWLWRAVDSEGEVLDLLGQRRRDKVAAEKLMRKLLRKQGYAPTVLVTDKLRSYGAARAAIGMTARQEQGLRANNRAENSHQPVRRRSGRCNGSSRLDPPSVSCLLTPLSTTPSRCSQI